MADILSQEELDALLSAVGTPDEPEEAPAAPAPKAEASGGGGEILSQDELDALLSGGLDMGSMDMGGPPEPEPEPEPKPKPRRSSGAPSASGSGPDAGPAARAPSKEPANLKLLLSIPVQVSVELGRTRMSVGDLLQLGQGSIIELDRPATDMLDLTVNHKRVALGEVVVVHENFGFRALEVDTLKERLNKL